MLCVEIDELTPCLKDNTTGEIINTEVLRVTRKSFLSKFNRKNGWYVNWKQLCDGNREIYALVIEGSVDIQGLIAITPNKDYDAVYIDWAVAAPQNNKVLVDTPKYIGVGGHLFAVAINKSYEYGFNGVVTGFASNKKLVEHYVETLGAEWIGVLHPYQIIIEGNNAEKIKEVYDYEWSDDEL
jgi:hypothetical protein